MWAWRKEKERFVEEIVNEILYGSRSEHKLRYKLKNMGEKEIKSKIYRIFNQKVKSDSLTRGRVLYSEDLKNKIKIEFFKILSKQY